MQKISSEQIGRGVHSIVENAPWTNVYGVGRTLLALGTLGTLLFTHTSSLFRPTTQSAEYIHCGGLADATLYCLLPLDHLEWGRMISIAVLIVTASGWRPRLTAIPQWWVTMSLQASIVIPDGGDQIAAVLTFLLIPVALTDNRVWHWTNASAIDRPGTWFLGRSLIAWSASFVIRLQVAGVYFQASVAKLPHPEWADGTAIYYWLNDPMFGAPVWLRPGVGSLTHNALLVQSLTWGALIIEFAVALGLIARRSVRPYLLLAGLSLHLAIGILMGLPSFSITMFGALVLFLKPFDEPFKGSKKDEVTENAASSDHSQYLPGSSLTDVPDSRTHGGHT